MRQIAAEQDKEEGHLEFAPEGGMAGCNKYPSF
jgi:hypothetical protein